MPNFDLTLKCLIRLRDFTEGDPLAGTQRAQLLRSVHHARIDHHRDDVRSDELDKSDSVVEVDRHEHAGLTSLRSLLLFTSAFSKRKFRPEPKFEKA